MGSIRPGTRRGALILFALGTVLGIGLGPGRSHGRQPADHSKSTRLTGAGAIALEGHRRGKIKLEGTVTAIERAAGSAGHMWRVVRLRVAPPASTSSFLLNAASNAVIPFAAGDLIRVEIDCTRGGWHYVCNATIRDKDDALLIGVAADANEAFAPGWKQEMGPLASAEPRQMTDAHRGIRSVRKSYRLLLRYRGRTGITDPGRWRRLDTPDGSWLIIGQAIRWEGLRPSEGVDYGSFSVVRLGKTRDRR